MKPPIPSTNTSNQKMSGKLAGLNLTKPEGAQRMLTLSPFGGREICHRIFWVLTAPLGSIKRTSACVTPCRFPINKKSSRLMTLASKMTLCAKNQSAETA
jgi:hypothetical protein